MELHELLGKVISILNMKGGVGKTTASAHVMRILYHHLKKKVLLVDLDAQYNLTQTVRTQAQHEEALTEGHTIISCFEPLPSNDFFKIRQSDQPPPQASKLSVRLRSMRGGSMAKLDLVNGSFELVKYSLIDDPVQLKSAADYFKRFMSMAREEYDLVVLDCNPSSSFVTKCALEASSFVLSPVKPDKYSVLGVGLVDKLFSYLKLNPEYLILVNGVRRSEPISPVELSLRAHPKFGPRVLVNRLVQSKMLSADPGYTGFATDRKGPYSSVLRLEIGKIAQEISERVWGN